MEEDVEALIAYADCVPRNDDEVFERRPRRQDERVRPHLMRELEDPEH